MKNFQIEDLSLSTVSFKATKLKNGRVLWVNEGILNNHPDFRRSDLLEKFRDRFAYAIKGNQFFEEICFDITDEIFLTAERYGGARIGANAGGSRCGNISTFQVKGVGKNPLAANDNADHWHTYGGLNLVDGIYETIYATVLGKILPLGTVTVYGIICTGSKTAMLPGQQEKPMNDRRGFGGLVVRDACVRPAHFFRAPLYEKQRRKSGNFQNDVARTRAANKKLLRHSGTIEKFLSHFLECLSNHANQLAFARAVRLTHGSLSPSNLSFDGRWLDLSSASFIEGGVNRAGSVDFYSEPEKVLFIFEEFVHTFSKYNRLFLDFQVFRNYFYREFDRFFISHVEYVLGINGDDSFNIKSESFTSLTSLFSSVITSAKSITYGRSYAHKKDDPVITVIELLFLSLSKHHDAELRLKKYHGRLISDSQVLFDFKFVLEQLYEKLGQDWLSKRSFFISIAIYSLKRALITEFFFLGRLEEYIYEVVKNSEENLFESIISDSIAVADWAFSRNELLFFTKMVDIEKIKVVIYRTNLECLYFCPHLGCFCIEHSAGEIRNFDTYREALSAFRGALEICAYSFSNYLCRIGNTLDEM